MQHHVGLALPSISCGGAGAEGSSGHRVRVAEGLPKPGVLFRAGCEAALFGKVSNNRGLYILLGWD